MEEEEYVDEDENENEGRSNRLNERVRDSANTRARRNQCHNRGR